MPRPRAATRMVVADADRAAAAVLAAHFQQRGITTYSTSREEDVLWEAAERRFDLAVIDLRLEDMAGMELVRQLRAMRPPLPVIVTSSDPRPEAEVEARRAGLLYYAPKPIHLEALQAVVLRALYRP